ncbi:hypothetical protein GOEFS_121_00170 [Gordonia effusa NBRC 100432]|uniref:Restriction endonuclease type IV Mrr domain-containing protein n=1 Tax=Gordonia effusa NBRC 100432 TaxID=1077974 RepID=H0R6B4_9ACTN|nr:restriction endonuclease [Gordonia effusa]GAB20615.1 hypothetical protein GOEFS_121_00170 [Gordonia effusa NBRC 100432]
MTRIEWTRLSGEEVEAVVGMLLCSRYPNAWRVRPGRGDGGVDIFVPQDPGRRRRKVFQVKRFAENLTNSPKRKIVSSFNRVVTSAEAEGWDIDSWTLVMPLDPTPGNEGWFTTFTESAGFPCEWMGLNQVEYLVSQNPKVIDYYLRDGRERLQEQLDRLAGIIAGREGRSTGEPLEPIDVRNDLLDIYQAINEYDPHYRYEVSMTAQPPERTSAHRAGLVAVSGYGSDSHGWVNVSIFVTCMAALEERPLTGNLTIYAPEAGTELAEQYRRFLDYGTPVELPEGQSVVDFPLPGGLGVSSSDGRLQIAPVGDDGEIEPPAKLVVGVLSPAGETIAEVQVERVERTQGPNGGYRTVWRDAAGMLLFEILVPSDASGTVNVSLVGDYVGRAPDDVVDALEFWSHSHRPNSVGLSRVYGPREYSTMRSGELPREPDSEMKSIARTARNLSVIQVHTSHRLLLPSGMTRAQALEVHRIAQIMSGNAVRGTWAEFDVVLHAGGNLALEVGDEISVAVVQGLELELGGVTVSVGKEIALLEGRVAVLTDTKLKVEPRTGADGDVEVVELRFDGSEDDGRVFYKALNDAQQEAKSVRTGDQLT